MERGGHGRWSSYWSSWIESTSILYKPCPWKKQHNVPWVAHLTCQLLHLTPICRVKVTGLLLLAVSPVLSQQLTGKTHWPKIRKLACTAPTSPVICHRHSFYIAPLQERWHLIQGSSNLELWRTNEVMGVCLWGHVWHFTELAGFLWVSLEMAFPCHFRVTPEDCEADHPLIK
jgi:hypothetical protein